MKLDLFRSTNSKNSDQINILISSQFTEYVQHQVFYQMQQQIHKFLYFKLKTEVIIDLKSFLVTELSKFGFMYVYVKFGVRTTTLSLTQCILLSLIIGVFLREKCVCVSE